MKKVFKWFWYGVAGIVVIIMAMTFADEGGETKGGTETAEKVTESEKDPSEGKDTERITKAEFEAIESGMTYDEVVEIIGGPGEVMSESGNEGETSYTVMYSWDGKGQMGANANVTFQGGEVINKAQFGLGK